MRTHLDGAVAIVTGAAKGIGLAESRALLDHGARVVMNDVDDAVVGIAAELRATGEVVPHVGDISDWTVADDVVAAAVATFGTLDILVNNAGISRDRTVVNLERDDWERILAVNLGAHVATCRAAARHWRSVGPSVQRRRIINTTSLAGLSGASGLAAYACSKSGVATLTMVLAKELASSGVTCNAIAPRAETELLRRLQGQRAVFDEQDVARWTVDSVAALVAYLASDRAGSMTGEVLYVGGDEVRSMTPWAYGGTTRIGASWTPEEIDAAVRSIVDQVGSQ